MSFRSRHTNFVNRNSATGDTLKRILLDNDELVEKWPPGLVLTPEELAKCMKYALYNPTWSVQLSIRVIRFLLAGGKEGLTQDGLQVAAGSSGTSGVCHTVWGKDELAYKCKTCERDPTCAICVPCFRHGNHEGHDYAIIRTAGGCCDCGDGQAWVQSGFCSLHDGAHAEDEDPGKGMPADFRERLVTAVGLIADEVAFLVGEFHEHIAKSRLISTSQAELNLPTIIRTDLGAVLELLGCLNEVAKAGDGVRRIMGLALVHTQLEWNKRCWLDYMLSIDGCKRLPPIVQVTLHSLYYQLITDLVFKRSFIELFVKYYSSFIDAQVQNALRHQAVEAERSSSHTETLRADILENFSVQLFTVPALTQVMRRENGLLDVLMYKVLRLLEFTSNSVVAMAEKENEDQENENRGRGTSHTNIHTQTVDLGPAPVQLVAEEVTGDEEDIEMHGVIRAIIDAEMEEDDAGRGHEGDDTDSSDGEHDNVLEVSQDRDTAYEPENRATTSDNVADKERCLRAALRCAAGEGPIAHFLKVDWSRMDDFKETLCFRIMYDLRYVLTHKSVATYFIHQRKDLFRLFVRQLSMLQGMHAIKRKRRMHLAYDTHYWSTAYSLELEFCALIDLVVVGFLDNPDPSVLSENSPTESRLSAIKIVRQCLDEWLAQEENVRSRFRSEVDDGEPFDSPVMVEPVSVHLPLHRFLALLAHHAIRVDGCSVSEALGGATELDAMNLITHPLRVQAFFAQVRADLWRRNGAVVVSQSILYRSSYCVEWFIDLDIFILQMAFTLVNSYYYINKFIDMFGLRHTLDRLHNVDEKFQLKEHEGPLLEELLSLFVHVSAERARCGLTSEQYYYRKLLHILCIADQTHSQLTRACSRHLHIITETCPSPLADDILKNIAKFVPPTGVTQGRFTPSEAAWDEYDPFCAHLTLRNRASAEERLQRHCHRTKRSHLVISRASTRKTPLYDSMNLLTRLPFALCQDGGLVNTLFQRCSKASRGLEVPFAACLYLSCLGLREGLVDGKSNVVNQLIQISMRPSARELQRAEESSFLEEAKASIDMVLRFSWDSARERGSSLRQDLRRVLDISDQNIRDRDFDEKKARSRERARKLQRDALNRMQEMQKKFAESLPGGSTATSNETHASDEERFCALCKERRYNKSTVMGLVGYAARTMIPEIALRRAGELAELDYESEKSLNSGSSQSLLEQSTELLTSCNMDKDINNIGHDPQRVMIGRTRRAKHALGNSLISRDIATFSRCEGTNRRRTSMQNSSENNAELVLSESDERGERDQEIEEEPAIGSGLRGEVPYFLQKDGACGGLIDWNLVQAGADGSCGPCVSLCGHIMHEDCFEEYFRSLSYNRRTRTSDEYELFSLERGEFHCPVCRRVANVLIPLRSDEDAKIFTEEPLNDGMNSVQPDAMDVVETDEFGPWFSRARSVLTNLHIRSAVSPGSTGRSIKWPSSVPKELSHLDIVLEELGPRKHGREVTHLERLRDLPPRFGGVRSRAGKRMSLASTTGVETMERACMNEELTKLSQMISASVVSVVVAEIFSRSCSVTHEHIGSLFRAARYMSASLAPLRFPNCAKLVHISAVAACTMCSLLLSPEIQVDPFCASSLLLILWPESLRRVDIIEIIRLGYTAIKITQEPRDAVDQDDVGKALLCMRLLFLRRMVLVTSSLFGRKYALSPYRADGELQTHGEVVSEHNLLIEEIGLGDDLLYGKRTGLGIIPETNEKQIGYEWRDCRIRANRRKGYFGAILERSRFTPRRTGLIMLPRLLQKLLEILQESTCLCCRKIPKKAALCLSCGEVVCHEKTKECSSTSGHAILCGRGFGMFLMVVSTGVRIVRNERKLRCCSPYLDDFGEEDLHLRRGKPLYLNLERYRTLERIWFTHGFNHSTGWSAGSIEN